MKDDIRGWKTVRLADVCEFSRGLTYKKSDEVEFSGNAVLRANNISLEYGELNFDDIRYILDSVSVADSKKIKKGCLLVCTASGSKKHLGKIALVDSDYDYAFGGFMGMLIPNHEVVDAEFLYFVTRSTSYAEFIDQLSDGANINNLKFSQLGKYTFRLPPLPEQKRIVAILDEAFAGIATAVANTEKNLANARELFESYLNSLFGQQGEGWTERDLGQIADFKNGLNFTKGSGGERVLIVGVKNFKSNYWVPADCLEIAQVDGRLSTAYELKKSDIVIVRSNGNKQLIGRCMLAGELTEKTSHSGFTIRVRLKVDELDPEFLAHYLRTSRMRERLIASGDGANISSLNQKALATLPVRYPAKGEQIAIVRGIQEIDAESKQLESIYHQKLTALAELKQSLLQKAFSGELTAGEAASDPVRMAEDVA